MSISRLFLFPLGISLACAGGLPGTSKPADVMVEIDGQKFNAADIQQKNPGSTFQARNALFEAERKALDDFINAQVLQREAQKQNLTVDQLLERDAYASLPKDPSDEALRVYYDGIDTAEPYDAVRDKIRDLVRQRRMAKAKNAYVQTLRGRADIKIRLQPPRVAIAVGDAPVRGLRGGRVTVIEYADYECPYCQQIQPVIKRILEEYSSKVAFAFKDVPLPMHANAQKAAEAAHCAGTQGKFWEYHDRLFTTKQYALLQLKDHARTLGLDMPGFELCLDSGSEALRIQSYVAEAQAIGLPGTPGFFVNGRFLSGAVDYDVLRKAIDEELQISDSSEKEAAQVRGQ